MFDQFLARFTHHCHRHTVPLVRAVHEGDPVYLVAFPAYQGEKKTLLPLDQVIGVVEHTQAISLQDPVFLSALGVSRCHIGLMPCTLSHQHGIYTATSPAGAHYLNVVVSEPPLTPLVHDYTQPHAYLWIISQPDETKQISRYPAYELEYVLYQLLHYPLAFATLMPLISKGVYQLFQLTAEQKEQFYFTLLHLHKTFMQSTPFTH